MKALPIVLAILVTGCISGFVAYGLSTGRTPNETARALWDHDQRHEPHTSYRMCISGRFMSLLNWDQEVLDMCRPYVAEYLAKRRGEWDAEWRSAIK